MNEMQTIITTILKHYPEVQAVYLFGSYGAGNFRPDSDVDLALLLPPAQARRERTLHLSPCQAELQTTLGREVDLLNARQVSTVFQKEIITGQRIYCADEYAADEFEMLTLSYYQKLNEERQHILEAFYRTGRAYAV